MLKNSLPLLCFCVVQLATLFLFAEAWVSENRRIEQEILRNYDRRHRPVKRESTIVRVQLFMTVNHIERVDEQEGTMTLHGMLWSSWYDEYLSWKPSDHNNTHVISIDAWKIWQPSFALYNSARANAWYVYMNGVPATVSNDGRVFAAGTFSFQVTCQFDFSDYPYDVQECPIVLADWMFDASKLNISEAIGTTRSGLNSLAKPAIRLSFDPLSENVKKHVSGWEVLDSWQRLCYWGPNGYCVDENPIGQQLDNYWSLIEFGVRIKRHAPYYGLTLVIPILVSMCLTLLIFWLDNLPLAIFFCTFNLILESYSGLSLLQQLPPGDGVMPTVGVVHMWNMSLTLVALTVHCLLHFLLSLLPPETKILPEQLTNFTSVLRKYRFFQTRGISFDPQTLMGFDPLGRNRVGYSDLDEEDDPELAITNQMPVFGQQSLIIEMEPVDPLVSGPSTSSAQKEQADIMKPSTSQVIKGILGNVFSQKEEKKEKGPIISSPFSSDLLGSKGGNIFKTVISETPAEQLEDSQLLIRTDDVADDAEKEEEQQPKDNVEKEDVNADVSPGKSEATPHTMEPMPKSQLEKELMALRRLIFGFFLFISAILFLILVF